MEIIKCTIEKLPTQAVEHQLPAPALAMANTLQKDCHLRSQLSVTVSASNGEIHFKIEANLTRMETDTITMACSAHRPFAYVSFTDCEAIVTVPLPDGTVGDDRPETRGKTLDLTSGGDWSATMNSAIQSLRKPEVRTALYVGFGVGAVIGAGLVLRTRK